MRTDARMRIPSRTCGAMSPCPPQSLGQGDEGPLHPETDFPPLSCNVTPNLRVTRCTEFFTADDSRSIQ